MMIRDPGIIDPVAIPAFTLGNATELSRVDVVMNWFEELERLVPTGER